MSRDQDHTIKKKIGEKNIIEIGPGPGGLTRSIFIQGANSIIAIEKDYKSIKCLQSLQDICGNKLKTNIIC